MKTLNIIITILLLFALGCSKEKVSPEVVELEIDYQWTEEDRGSTKNPKIVVKNVPQNTTTFYVDLVNLNNPGSPHGGGYVQNDGTGVIGPGTIKGYYWGPDPPPPIRHDYEITVVAMDWDLTIGIGKLAKIFPPEKCSNCRRNKKKNN
jgi:hypothetical protein